MNEPTEQHTYRGRHRQLLNMLGAREHQDAAGVIGQLQGLALEAERLRAAAETRETLLGEQTRMLWLVIRAAGGTVRVPYHDAAITDWSRSTLQRSDDMATRDMVLTATLRRFESDGPADADDGLVEVGEDVPELQRALVKIAEALGSECELDDMLHAIDRLARADEDATNHAARADAQRQAADAVVNAIAQDLGVRPDLAAILAVIEAYRVSLGMSADIDSMALALARRFVPHSEPQRLAALQVAIIAAINTHGVVTPANTYSEQVRGSQPVVTITVSGIVGVGKSGIALVVLDALRAAGLPCEWADEVEERGMGTEPGNWRGMKAADVPVVRLVEVVEPRQPMTQPATVSTIMAAGVGARRITAARLHQLTGEGYSRAADQRYVNGELVNAAVAYLSYEGSHGMHGSTPPRYWPWDADAYKPKAAVENLERAGALIAAEIDRLEAGNVTADTGHATIPVALVGEWEARAQAVQQEEARAAEFEARAALADDVSVGAVDRPLDGLPPGYAPKPDAPAAMEPYDRGVMPAVAAQFEADAAAHAFGRLADFPANTAPEGKPIPVLLDDGRVVTDTELAWKRDDETTFITILLIDSDTTGFANETTEAEALARIKTWTDAECEAVEDYCRAVHIQASDNDDFPLPAKPAVLGWNPAKWGMPMATAPMNGTMLRLLVVFTEHDTEDTGHPSWTIGAFSSHAKTPPAGEPDGNWQFAGWCWTHDHFTEGKGTPIGWLPMIGQDGAP